MAPQKKSVSQLPLFSDWHAVSTKNTHIGATPVLTLRLRSLGGEQCIKCRSQFVRPRQCYFARILGITLRFYETIGCGTSASQALAQTPSATRSLPSATVFRREFLRSLMSPVRSDKAEAISILERILSRLKA
jgi:hypothetical protein